MSHDTRSDEDAGYGNSSLVGDDRAGLRSALQARDAARQARRAAPHDEDRSATLDADSVADSTTSDAKRDAAPRSDVLGGRASLGDGGPTAHAPDRGLAD